MLLLVLAIVIGAKLEYRQVQRRLGQALGRNYWRHRLTQVSTEDLRWDDDFELTSRKSRSATETTYVDEEAGRNAAKIEESDDQNEVIPEVKVERGCVSYRKPKRPAPKSPPSEQITTTATIESSTALQLESTKNLASGKRSSTSSSSWEKENRGRESLGISMEDEIGAGGSGMGSEIGAGGRGMGSAITE